MAHSLVTPKGRLRSLNISIIAVLSMGLVGYAWHIPLANAIAFKPALTATIAPPQSNLPFHLYFQPTVADIGDDVRATITLSNPTTLTATQVVITNHLTSYAVYQPESASPPALTNN